jgi:hypothetical protein
LVVVSCSNGQGLLVEIPNLSFSTVCNLDNHVPVVDQVEVSVLWKLRDNIEISLNIETESLVELSLGWLSLPFINVDDIPLLMNLIIPLANNDVSVFRINTTLNFQNLSFIIDYSRTLVSEELPPS